MSARNGNTARVTEVLRQYRDPITASEIADLLIDVPLGTVHSTINELIQEGRVTVTNMGHKPRKYIYDDSAQPQPQPEPVVVPADPWSQVIRKWYAVFGVAVSPDDARLMVEIAYREVR